MKKYNYYKILTLKYSANNYSVKNYSAYNFPFPTIISTDFDLLWLLSDFVITFFKCDSLLHIITYNSTKDTVRPIYNYGISSFSASHPLISNKSLNFQGGKMSLNYTA